MTKPSLEEIKEFLNEYKKKRTIAQIAEDIGINKNTLLKYLYKTPGRITPKIQDLFFDFMKKHGWQPNSCENETKPEKQAEDYKDPCCDLEVVQLYNYEELIEALRNGEIIYSNGFEYELSNNILLKKQSSNVVAINPALLLDVSYFVKGKKQLKLKVGCKYLSDSGVYYIFHKNNNDLFMGINKQTDEIIHFRENGEAFDSVCDLIKEV